MLYLCICEFLFVHLCIWQSRISFLMSLDRWLFKNITHVGYFRHFITGYVNFYLCIWQSRISFLMSLDPWLFKNIAYVGYFGDFVICCICVFVYLWICICVFVYLTVQNIIFDILEPPAVQKYSTWWVFLSFCHMLYLCSYEFVFVYLCICICVYVYLTAQPTILTVLHQLPQPTSFILINHRLWFIALVVQTFTNVNWASRS